MTGLHIRRNAVILVSLVAVLAGSCRRSQPADESPPPAAVQVNPALLDGRAALDRVRKFLESGPRCSGSPGAERAAQYILGELQRLGVSAEIDEFVDETPGGRRTFRNVIGHVGVPGRKMIVLGSHYDTKSGIGPNFQGANDSGSSTGLLLELASVFKKCPLPGTEIVLAFFDGEECSVSYGRNDGLHGSRRLARLLVENGASGRVQGVVVLDMVGDKDLNVCIPYNSTPALCAAVFEAAYKEGVRSKFSRSRGDVLDDHVPFLEVGLAALDMIDFTYGSSAELNDYWHTEADTIDKLSAESLEQVGRVTIRLVNFLSENDRGTAR